MTQGVFDFMLAAPVVNERRAAKKAAAEVLRKTRAEKARATRSWAHKERKKMEQAAIVRQAVARLRCKCHDDDIGPDGISPSRDNPYWGNDGCRMIALTSRSGRIVNIRLSRYADAVHRLGWRVARDLAFLNYYSNWLWPS